MTLLSARLRGEKTGGFRGRVVRNPFLILLFSKMIDRDDSVCPTSCPAWPLNAASRRAPARRLIFGIVVFHVVRGLTLIFRQQKPSVCIVMRDSVTGH